MTTTNRKSISSHTKNSLDKAKSYRLTSWIDTNKETLEKLTQPKIADLATSALGFTVTVGNIFGASNALGIKLGQRIIRAAPAKDTNRTVARHLVYLYEKLGEPVPESLNAIATR